MDLIVRVSSLPRYNDCPRSNAVRFIGKQIKDAGHELAVGTPSIAAAMGTSLHAMMAELFKQKMRGDDMSLTAAFAAREKAFEEEVSQGALWDTTTPHFSTAKSQLEAMCRAFLPIAMNVDPVAVEDELEYTVSPLGTEAVPIRLIGHRDVKDKQNEIHDHKTGSEFPPCHAQLGGYVILSRLLGEEVSACRVNFAPRLPLSRLHETSVRSLRFPIEDCVDAAWSNLTAIQIHYMRWLESGSPDAFPANPYSQSCTEKYCRAYNTSWCRVGACA